MQTLVEVMVEEKQLVQCACSVRKVVGNLKNPRGLHLLPDGTLLVAEAGTGSGDGRVLRLHPKARYFEPGDMMVDGLPSVNVLPDVKREEIVGISALDVVNDVVVMLVSDLLAGVARLVELGPISVQTLLELPGPVNDFVYYGLTGAYYVVRPNQDDVCEIRPTAKPRPLTSFSKLSDGQDAVPCAICFDEWSNKLLVTLLSGEVDPDRKEGELHPISTTGIGFLNRAGGVFTLDPITGDVNAHVLGLTIPTDTLVHKHHLFVIEGCTGFLEPLLLDAHFHELRHGGFRRFSGRLIHLNRKTGQVSLLADKLDLPSNLLLSDDGQLLVSQGAGIVGRPIPGPNGEATSLEGFISVIDVSSLLCE
ncbi:MAG: hypothetical protein QNJ55_32435 [Xenococcus sp. MO_188.B8]|nr:hypothetical protein [Xenococcus sp. MO_188.B8]